MQFSSYDLAGPDPKPMTKGEVTVLKELVNRIFPNRPIVIVNIGAERGVSTLAMLEERPSAIIFSIDINPCEAEFENARKARLATSSIIRLLGRSQHIGHAWPFKVDFVWVDGDHSCQGVRDDIKAWWPRLTREGVMAFHDCFDGEPPEHNPSGAGRAVREMMGDYELIASFERIRAFRK